MSIDGSVRWWSQGHGQSGAGRSCGFEQLQQHKGDQTLYYTTLESSLCKRKHWMVSWICSLSTPNWFDSSRIHGNSSKLCLPLYCIWVNVCITYVRLTLGPLCRCVWVWTSRSHKAPEGSWIPEPHLVPHQQEDSPHARWTQTTGNMCLWASLSSKSCNTNTQSISGPC